ncbi:YhgE/Pip domain-containing protein [Streptomyces sp. NPDC085932]|uniref:YhgE/Pip domain-containing protein n=1 Tax=Streptomyces sp. NPDC085932 TaxID=3365741 RepID=UPI0037D0B9D1
MKSLRLAWLELQRLRGPRLQWVPALLVILPVLSAGIVMASLWDPEGRFGRVPAAIVNLDQPVTAGPGTPSPSPAPARSEAGTRLVQQLRLQGAFAWRTMDRETARRQLRDGDIYFALIIPETFSRDLAAAAGQDSGTHAARLTLELNDANGYLITRAATAHLDTVREQATAIALHARAEHNADTWKEVRRTVDELLNTDITATPRPGASPQPATPPDTSFGVSRLASRLNEATDTISKVNDVIQEANNNSGTMTFQLNDAASNAQSAQDSAGSNNQALVQHNTGQASTSVRLAQNTVTTVNSKLQSAAADTKGLLDNVTRLAADAKTLDAALSGLNEQLRHLARLVPPAQATDAARRGDIVTVDEDNLHPARSLGQGLAPLAFSLLAWAGVLLTLSVLRPVNPRALVSPMNTFAITRAGWLPMATLTTLAVSGFFALTQALMHLGAPHPWATLGLCTLMALAFAAVGHLLKTLFGPLGEIVLVLLAALQLASCGGLYPVQTTNALFINLHPYLPMTYTVDALRTLLTGGPVSTLWSAVAVLITLTVVCLAASALCLTRRRQYTGERLAPAFRERC